MNKFAKDDILQIIINAFPGLMAYIDRDERFQMVNNAYIQWFEEPIVGRLVKDVFKDDYDIRKPYIERAFKGEKVIFQTDFNHNEKGPVPIEISYTPHFDEMRVVRGLVVVVNDISEHKKAETLAHEERETLYSLFMQAPVSICVYTGPKHRVELINSVARSTINNRDITGRLLEEAVPEIREVGLLEKIDLAYQSKEPVSIPEWPVTMTSLDGSQEQRILELRYVPWRKVDGSVAGLLYIGIDITHQVKSREHLAQNEQRFRTYAESIPQMAFMANTQGDITYYNRRWKEYSGMEPEEAMGWDWKPMVHPDDLTKTIEAWKNVIEKDEPYQMEYRLKRYDGVFRWHLVIVVPIKNAKGTVIGWMGTNTDIHHHKEIEARLERTLQGRDEFLSIASHELKTPITSLKLQAQMFLRAIEKGDSRMLEKDRLESTARHTNEWVNRLSKQIENMLDVSRINTGRIMLEKKPVDLVKLLKESVSNMKRQFKEAQVTVPQIKVAEAITGTWDAGRIEQIINNLLTNALRYGEGKPITIDVWKEKDKACFTVTDEGLGISPENRERIFDRYERAVDHSEIRGMGLGLYITRQLVNAHGGRIWVDSQLGHGSKFAVELPL